MRRPFLILSAAAILGAAAVAAILPPRALRLDEVDATSAPVMAGAFHVHSNRSDGSGSVDDIAAAAARAGLQFVILTDHGNGTRAPEPPAYRSGVLMIDGVEISTAGGHYAVVGMQRAPYPLAGEPRDVVEDVRRLGGFGIVAHGDSPRPELEWTDWSARVDGIEWLSLDTAWRRASYARLVKAAAGYWFRKPESVASILTRPTAPLARFDELARARPTITVVSTDAHGLWAPSYEACFRAMTTRVELDRPRAGNAAADGAALVAAFRSGRHYSAIDAFGTPPTFEFLGYSESGDGDPARQGDSLAPNGRAILQARISGPAGASLVLFRDGEIVREARAETMIHQTDGRRGAYRIEVRLPGFDVPWIVSNPIHVGRALSERSESKGPALSERSESKGMIDVVPRGKMWAIDQDPRSMAKIERQDGVTRFRYELASGEPRDQFASMLVLVPESFARYRGIMIDAEASRPLRMFVQLVDDTGASWSRWQRSIYLDATRRTITVSFNDLRPLRLAALAPFDFAQGAPSVSRGAQGTAPPVDTPDGPPALGKVDALVFLIDTNHTSPGTGGEILFHRVAYQP